MKTLIFLTVNVVLGFSAYNSLSTNTSQSSISLDSNRFIITVDGKTGYIDNEGIIVIEPIFESGQEFSEGLCAVRKNGFYGFINPRGEFVIKPRFDYATQFVEGAALTFIDGKPVFVDKRGDALFPSAYKSMTAFSNGKSWVRTHSGKAGIVNKKGHLLIDTVYSRIGDFSDGLAVAYGADHQTYSTKEKSRKLQATIIDTLGRRIVAYGKYSEIIGPSEGYFRASTSPRFFGNGEEHLLDRTGKKVYVLSDPGKNYYSSFEGDVCNGVIRATMPGQGTDKGNNHDVYMTPDGQIIFENVSQRWTRNFSDNRAFIQNDDETYSIINKKGKIVSDIRYKDVLLHGFYKGRAFVQTDGGWGVIDTLGQFIVVPKFGRIHEASAGTDHIFFTNMDSVDGNEVYGIADALGDVILTPRLEQFDERGFVNGLLFAYVDGKSAYISEKGKTVWEGELQPVSGLQPLDIDHMKRGYFHASSQSTGHGYEEYGAEPQVITKANSFKDGVFEVIAVPERQHEARASIRTMTIFVANSTLDTVNFNAQDGRLYMKMQAKDKTGAWRDIEYLPNSWCGNSYHTMWLAPGNYWSFAAPVYQGALETKLRVELKVVDGKIDHTQFEHKKNEKIFYSNEFNGSVNPGQFWRKPGYTPMGIMDPYLE